MMCGNAHARKSTDITSPYGDWYGTAEVETTIKGVNNTRNVNLVLNIDSRGDVTGLAPDIDCSIVGTATVTGRQEIRNGLFLKLTFSDCSPKNFNNIYYGLIIILGGINDKKFAQFHISSHVIVDERVDHFDFQAKLGKEKVVKLTK